MSDDNLKKESEHIECWEDCLNSLSKQFEIILNLINLNNNIQKKRISFVQSVKSSYESNCKSFKNEPSHIFFLPQIYLDFYSYLGNKMNPETKKLLLSTIKETIRNLDVTKNETCNDIIILIAKCKNLILSIKKQEEDYQKAKTALDDAIIYQKKINNLDKYTYNVTKKQKADLSLAEKIKEMDKIKNPLDNNKKKLKESQEKLNNLIKNNFEIIVSVCFKGLSNYYQCLYLVLNHKSEILNNIKQKLDDLILQLTNLVFDLNDYSEKKFGEYSLGLKTEGLNIYSSIELINKSSMNQLIEISNNIINYVKIFLTCLRYRKKIMKIFLDSLAEILKFETENIKLYNKNKKEFINILDSLKIINNNSQRFLRNLISKERLNETIQEIYTLNSSIKNYIDFVRNEYYSFLKSWESYESKIMERQKLSKEFLDEIKEAKKSNKKIDQIEFINRNEKKKTKLRNVILTALDFIQKNVTSSRERDKTEMMKLESIFEKIFLNCQNFNNAAISNSENELNNAVTNDIFDECKLFILKYFNRFKIQNYDNFIERIKMKLLINTDLTNEKIGKIISGNITNEIESQIELSKENLNNIDDSSFDNYFSSEYYFKKGRKQSMHSNSRIYKINSSPINNRIRNKNEYNTNINQTVVNNNKLSKFSIKNINNDNLNKTYNEPCRKEQNINNENNNNNLNEKDSMSDINIAGNEVIDEINQLSNYDILNELEQEDKIEFLTNADVLKYTETSDPFSNIKEDELDRLINMKKENSKLDLDDGEKIIDSFSCCLGSKIIPRGHLIITTKKINYYSSFLKKERIIIPLGDIISIKKRTNLGLNNSIEIKTEKVTHLFTSFMSRDHCYIILKNQIQKYKKQNNQEDKKEEEIDANSPEQQYLKKKRFKAKQITKMLEDIEFHKKIEQFTKERMELFTKEYYDEKKGVFIPQDKFKYKYEEVYFDDCPLFIPFYVLCNISSKLEEYKSEKGFFESLFLERGDTEVKFEESPEFSKDIPPYFKDGDYVMNLFSQLKKEEFETFLNDLQTWNKKYEGSCYANHKVKQVPFGPERVIMKDRFVTYFVSPTCLILDDMAFATGFQFCDNFIPLFRYKFDCNIKFNENKGKFEFRTKLTILYTTFFFANFFLKGAVESKSNSDTEILVKGEIIDKLKNSFNIYINKFKDIFERSTEETFQRKIDLKQNMITGEVEEVVIEGIDTEEKKEDDDQEKKEENQNPEDNKDTNENSGMNKKINEFIDKYKLYILIGIITSFIIEVIYSLFTKGKGSLSINTIFNLMILASIFYLFKFK